MPLSHWRLSLFWRTFLLVASLLLLGVGAAVYTTNTLEANARADRQALQVGSLVNLVRNALISSQGDKRAELLQQLRTDEGVQVRVAESNDAVRLFEPIGIPGQLFANRVRKILGERTRLAQSLNNENDFWVSFQIEDDEYWLGLNRSRVDGPRTNPLFLALVTALVALLTAALTSRLVNGPLDSLDTAIKKLANNEPVAPLPETGPSELAQLNKRFNQLARDLQQLEVDRSLALAGISHDIRTPLARLRLELEMAPISDADRTSMSEEIMRIDQIVGQFIDYARVHGSAPLVEVDVTALIGDVVLSFQPFVERAQLVIDVHCPAPVIWPSAEVELRRIIQNLIENARRYGQRDNVARVLVVVCEISNQLNIVVVDDGPGVPPSELPRLLKPFARMDVERNASGGAGLGLAIVDRLTKKLGGQLLLQIGYPGAVSGASQAGYRGLCAKVILPKYKATTQ
jgi:two-component system, OmpR family, osmolarity sensor histidine kinase EnvZ